MKVEHKLIQSGIKLTKPNLPVANYIAIVEQQITSTVSQIYISGQLPWTGKDQELITGTLGDDLKIEEGVTAARLAGINTLAIVKNHIGDLDKVVRIMKVECYVACTPDFKKHPQVANGCSDFFNDVFGTEIGSHSRIAIGVTSLPLGAAVEISSMFTITK